MDITQRHLILRPIALALLALVVLPLATQLPAASGNSAFFRTFCTALDGHIDGLFYLHHGKPVAVSAGNISLSRAFPAPANGVVSFYREEPSVEKDKPPLRVPVAEVRLGPGGPWLLLISTHQGKIHATAVDHSWERHPVGHLRIFNFCPEAAAFQVAKQSAIELAPGQDKVVPLPESELAQLRVKVATQKSGQWRLRISRPQRIPPPDGVTRLSWVLLEVPPDDDNPDSRFLLRNLPETAPITPSTPSN